MNSVPAGRGAGLSAGQAPAWPAKAVQRSDGLLSFSLCMKLQPQFTVAGVCWRPILETDSQWITPVMWSSLTKNLGRKASQRKWCARNERRHGTPGSQRSFDDSPTDRRFALKAERHQTMSLSTPRESQTQENSIPDCRKSRNTLKVKSDAGAREHGPGVSGQDGSHSGADQNETEMHSSVLTTHDRSLGEVSRLTRSAVWQVWRTTRCW